MESEILITLGGVVYVIIEAAGILAAINAVMSTRTSQGAIAWAVSLVSFPIVSLPLYLVFGRNRFQGYVTARRSENQEFRKIISGLVKEHPREKWAVLEGELAPFHALVELTGMPLVEGNTALLLIDGKATFEAIFQGIREAKEYILVQFYIVNDDELGRELRDLLIQRAREGVRVYFLYDPVGCIKLPPFYTRAMINAGIEVRPFQGTAERRSRFQINFRNHRKIVLIDGKTAYVGGHNVGDEYLGKHPKLTPWRDTHVRVEGPSVLKVQLSFVEDWYWANGKVPELNWEPQITEGRSVKTLVVPSGPADDQETCSLMFTHLINSARERFWIVSPYFVPDESLMSALKLAALRGVDVRIMIPDNPDHKLVYLAAFSYLRETEGTGVKIFNYREGFLHQKVLLVDDTISAIGTANLDNRSLRLNFELTMLFNDRELNEQVESMLKEDFSRCREAQAIELDQRNLLFKIAVKIARLLAPVL